MKEYTVDCEKLVNPEATHTILAEIFAFPPYYGRNLDALYDCLTALPDCRILLQHTRVFRDSGAFAVRSCPYLRKPQRNSTTCASKWSRKEGQKEYEKNRPCGVIRLGGFCMLHFFPYSSGNCRLSVTTSTPNRAIATTPITPTVSHALS